MGFDLGDIVLGLGRIDFSSINWDPEFVGSSATAEHCLGEIGDSDWLLNSSLVIGWDKSDLEKEWFCETVG